MEFNALDTSPEVPQAFWGKPAVRDFAISIGLAFLAYIWAFYYLETWPGTPSFYQAKCAPAVMIGLGYNYCEPAPPVPEAIADFLSLQSETLDPAALPETIEILPPGKTLGFHLYAYYAMGLLWRITGISWDALHYLMALLFAASVVCVWYILRLGAGRPVALPGALVLTFSPGYLYMLPQLRDFSKAPFVLAVIALLGYAVVRPRRLPGLLLLSGALGLSMGVGLGFRQDLLTCLPIAVVALLLFLPGDPRCTWARRLLSVTVVLACFFTVAYPVFKAIPSKTPNSFHAINLGLTAPFNRNLGLGGTPYDIGYYYRDEYIHTVLSSYAQAKLGREERLAYNSPDYDRVGAVFFLEQFLAHFPADFIARWYASVKRILDYSAFAIDSNLPGNLGDTRLENLVWFRWFTLRWLSGIGVWLASAALLVVSFRSVRLALCAAALFFYFGGYPSLQFMQRHYFFLEVLFWWAVTLLAWQSARGLWWLRRSAHRDRARETLGNIRRWWTPPVKRMLVFAGLMLLGLLVPLMAARVYQSTQVRGIYAAYGAVEGEKLEAAVEQGGRVTFRPIDFLDADTFSEADRTMQVQTGLLLVECLPSDLPFPLTFAYTATEEMNNFTRTVHVPPRSEVGDAPVRVFFPVYNAPPRYHLKDRRFVGVQVPQPVANHVRGLYAVRDYRELPVLLNLVLPAQHAGLPTCLRWKLDFPPAGLRACRSYSDDILQNGGFERWADDVEAPLGCMPPSALSVITRETETLAQGHSAVRQVWQQDDSLAPLQQRFYLVSDRFAAGKTYELFLHARVDVERNFIVSAWQVIEQANGQPQLVLLNPAVCYVSGTAASGFREYSGLFQVAETDHRFSVVLATSGTGKTQRGDTVVWDNWRAIPREIE